MQEMFRTIRAVAVCADLAGVTTSAGSVLVVHTVVLSETFMSTVHQGQLASRTLHAIQPDRAETMTATIDGDARTGNTNCM